MPRTIREETESFRAYQASLGRQGRGSAATTSLAVKVAAYTPGVKRNDLRWQIVIFVLRLIYSSIASTSLKIGAIISLLSSYAENPSAMIRGLINDPDMEVVIAEVNKFDEDIPDLGKRGKTAEKQAQDYKIILEKAPLDRIFIDETAIKSALKDTSSLNMALASILAQVWIMIAKSVTAPDTAEESEQRRWIKYVQQKRVDPKFTLTKEWIAAMRSVMTRELSVRKYMVEILVDVKRMDSNKGRIAEMIADIGNYVEETGMAGFFLTIKYGLEMRYPDIACHDFQADLLTMQNLMQTYKEIGIKAPYMVLIEDSVQTKFGPGNYPILWSFAMGVGTALDRSMGALNINRPFLEPLYFRLGQEAARRSTGSVDRKVADELGLTNDEIEEMKDRMRDINSKRHEVQLNTREGKFATSAGLIPTIDSELYDEQRESTLYKEEDLMPTEYTVPRLPSGGAPSSKIDKTEYLNKLAAKRAGRAAMRGGITNREDSTNSDLTDLDHRYAAMFNDMDASEYSDLKRYLRLNQTENQNQQQDERDLLGI